MGRSGNAPGFLDLSEVVFGDVRAPVLLERCERDALVLVLAERPLVDDTHVGVVEERVRRKVLPETQLWSQLVVASLRIAHLDDEPSAEADSTDRLFSIREAVVQFSGDELNKRKSMHSSS